MISSPLRLEPPKRAVAQLRPCQSNNNQEKKRHLPASPSATARRLNTNARTLAEVNTAFAFQLLHRSVGQRRGSGTGGARKSTAEPVRLREVAIRKQRDFGIGEQFDLAHDTIAAGEVAGSARVSTQTVLRDPQRVGEFERLGRRVERKIGR